MTPHRGRALAGALAALLVLAPVGVAAAQPDDSPDARPAVPAPARSAGGDTADTVAETVAEVSPEAPAPAGGPVTDRIIVKFAEGAEPGAQAREQVYDAAAERAADRPGGRGPGLPGTAAAVPDLQELRPTVDSARVVTAGQVLDAGRLDALVAELEEDPAVEYAEPDHLVRIASVPDDPYFPTAQWSLHRTAAGLGLPDVWGSATGRGQTIAVVDTGITRHPDLDANVLPGYDFVSLHGGVVQSGHSRDGDGWDPDPRDEGDYGGAGECASGGTAVRSSWHGTHTAGIAAARANNRTGVAGVAYDAKILPVRAIGACGEGYLSDIAVATAWAVGADVPPTARNRNPATVVNLSLGFVSSVCPAVLQDAVDSATARGAVVVAAAGNRNHDAVQESPANCRGVISVASSTASGSRAPYSNWGRVTLAAPGGDGPAQILSTANNGVTTPGTGGYANKFGTSMASPAVAGVVALVRETDPSLTPAQVRNLLVATARPLPGGCPGGCGAGLVNPQEAVSRVAVQGGYPTKGAIGALYERIRVATGAPRSPEVCGLPQGGCFQHFARGAIYWSPATGAQWVHGAVQGAWNRGGDVRGPLGYPRTGEQDNGAGGVHQLFRHGRIVWSPATGAAALYGAIGARHASTGGERGVLGHPLGDERAGSTGVAHQSFQHGRILWSAATGAHSLHGAIGRAHAGLGGESGRLGLPVSQEYAVGDSVVQRFQGGAIAYRAGGTSVSYR
ncbi:S8 family serine peptidase [Kocuria sp. M1R5S2]|uniref:S8 family serine peptidase n=1 Tax=Kocuria rhizosphaerae TaxID=3376285 RepID=UPI00379DEF5F